MAGHLFFNGAVVTMTSDQHMPQSVLTDGDRIAFTGRLEDAQAFAERARLHFTMHDLHGAALLPGFIDGHMHPLPMIFFAASADLENVRSLKDAQRIIRSQLSKLAGEEWLIGVQFEGKLLPAGQSLNATELDRITGERPALIYARDGHSVIVNTAVLNMLLDDKKSSDPEGGHIGRTEAGTPDGIFYEKAVNIPLAVMPPPSPARMMQAGKGLFHRMAEAGITSIGAMLQSDDEGPGGASARMESMIVQAVRDQIPQSIYAIVIGKTLNGLNALINSPMNEAGNATRTRAFKIFADGTFGSCTACMSEPYADKACSHGYMTLDHEEIFSRMEAAHLAGYQICIHAIGDQGISNCVDMFDRLLTAHPKPDHRHRIEHASIASKALAKRIATLGLGICTQPLFIRSEKDWLPDRLGEKRAGQAYPFRDYIDAGICLGGSSDAPIEATDVIASIDYAVNRGGFHPEQGVSVEEALAMFTRNAAWLQFEDNIKGTIEPGKQADLVILSENPLAVPASEVGRLSVIATMIRGAFVTSFTSRTASAGAMS